MIVMEELNIEDIISNLYNEAPGYKFDSYKKYLVWQKKYDEFYDKLSEELKKEAREVEFAYTDYEVEMIDECSRFSVKCYKKLIGLDK